MNGYFVVKAFVSSFKVYYFYKFENMSDLTYQSNLFQVREERNTT